MLTIKATIAAAILGATVAATAGVTYAVTRASMQISIGCPASNASTPASPKPDLPQGAPVPLNQGKTY